MSRETSNRCKIMDLKIPQPSAHLNSDTFDSKISSAVSPEKYHFIFSTVSALTSGATFSFKLCIRGS